MKAAVVTAFGAPLEVREVEVPDPSAGQVLVQVEASGLCHTDIHAARGDWPIKPKLPLIPGHEGVGRVAALGPDAQGLAVGDRVAMPWLGYSCGTCRYCVGGWETYCTSPQYMGYTMDGGYAQYAVAFARNVVRVPDSISSAEAAPITCAGVTTYKALKVARPRPTEVTAIVGIGGLGHLALQYAQVFGTQTVAIDVGDEKLQLAKDLGADHVIDGRGDEASALRDLGGVDIAVVTVPSPGHDGDRACRAKPERPARAGRASCRQHTAVASLRDGTARDTGHRLARRNPKRPDRGVPVAGDRPHKGHLPDPPARRR